LPESKTSIRSDSMMVFSRWLESRTVSLLCKSSKLHLTNAIVNMVTSANAGPLIISWISLSVSKSTADVADEACVSEDVDGWCSDYLTFI
jgi:hypothetical protein